MIRVRFGHFVPVEQSVDVYFDGEMLVTNLSYSNVTSYLDIPEKREGYHFKVTVSGSNEVLTEKKVKRFCKDNNSVIVYLEGKEIKMLVMDTHHRNPHSGTACLTGYNFAVNTPSLTFYLDRSSIFSDVSYGQDAKFAHKYSLSRGNVFHDLQVKLYRTNKTIIENPRVHLKSGNFYSIFAHGRVGDTKYPLTTSVVVDNPGLHDTLERNFDVQAYMNTWNQIANIPQPFEAGLNCANQKAQYTLLPEKVKIFNTCLGKDGKATSQAIGQAIIENPEQPAALTVSFPGFVPPPTQVGKFDPKNFETPPGPNYLVHSTDYDTYAIVGSSDRSALYILSRKEKMRTKLFDHLMKFCKKLGYDTRKVGTDYETLY